MKSTENFKRVIHNYLQKRAQSDELFAKTLAKPGKNIDDCITYILNTVQKSGCTGFEDDEIYSMAVHYYDEDNIDAGNPVNCAIVTNHTVELTPEEIEEAKAEARQKVIDEERARLTNPKVTITYNVFRKFTKKFD